VQVNVSLAPAGDVVSFIWTTSIHLDLMILDVFSNLWFYVAIKLCSAGGQAGSSGAEHHWKLQENPLPHLVCMQNNARAGGASWTLKSGLVWSWNLKANLQGGSNVIVFSFFAFWETLQTQSTLCSQLQIKS